MSKLIEIATFVCWWTVILLFISGMAVAIGTMAARAGHVVG